jgi:ABC-type lipoprotein export system ATPase subunit
MEKVAVLKGIDFLAKREFIAIMGRSGAGKHPPLSDESLDEPTSGEIAEKIWRYLKSVKASFRLRF